MLHTNWVKQPHVRRIFPLATIFSGLMFGLIIEFENFWPAYFGGISIIATMLVGFIEKGELVALIGSKEFSGVYRRWIHSALIPLMLAVFFASGLIEDAIYVIVAVFIYALYRTHVFVNELSAEERHIELRMER